MPPRRHAPDPLSWYPSSCTPSLPGSPSACAHPLSWSPSPRAHSVSQNFVLGAGDAGLKRALEGRREFSCDHPVGGGRLVAPELSPSTLSSPSSGPQPLLPGGEGGGIFVASGEEVRIFAVPSASSELWPWRACVQEPRPECARFPHRRARRLQPHGGGLVSAGAEVSGGKGLNLPTPIRLSLSHHLVATGAGVGADPASTSLPVSAARFGFHLV